MTSYVVFHQGRAHRCTRARPVRYAVLWGREHSLEVDKVVAWTASHKGAVKTGRQWRGRVTILPAAAE